MLRPTPEELRLAANQTMPDILAPHLDVVFCGINPSVYSVVVGHHFARPGNRFWPALHAGGFTPRRLMPREDQMLLDFGLGITNIAARSSVAAAELSKTELEEGAQLLEAKMEKFKPRVLAVLGISAYRTGFARPKAVLGLQEERIGGTKIWVLPNPSGLNAHYHPPQLARLFGELHEFVRQD
ncbi:MAG TPA: G/U mismatch-specific DNA glycosylase [Abditibacterium sp.]|jgi:TDG/mug DNA glycosylase family protein